MLFPFRFSLKLILAATLLVCLAFTWRSLCMGRLTRFQEVARGREVEQVIAMLDSESLQSLTRQIPLEEIDSFRVAVPEMAWQREAQTWGLAPLRIAAKTKPSDTEAVEVGGMSLYRFTYFEFQAGLRPWGLTGLEQLEEKTFTDANVALYSTRP